jgi:lipopolysaccharide transport system permease protein
VTSSTTEPPITVIKASRGWAPLDLGDLWNHRELAGVLIQRDLKLRYKETVLGVIWVVLQPLLASLVFALVFGIFARLRTSGPPYILVAFAGLVGYNLVSGIITRAGSSMLANSGLIGKVYFPRLLVPLAAIATAIVDAAVGLAVLFVLLIIYSWAPPLERLPMVLVFIAVGIALGSGVSLLVAAYNVKYRDIGQAIPFVLQVLLYTSPVAYPLSIVPDRFRYWYDLNPLVGILEGIRWSILGTGAVSPRMMWSSVIWALFFLVLGAFAFRRVERDIADEV